MWYIVDWSLTLDETVVVKCSLTMLDVDDQILLRGEVVRARSSRNVSHDVSRKSSLTVDSSFIVPFVPMDHYELLSLFHRIPVGFHCVSGMSVALVEVFDFDECLYSDWQDSVRQ